jgi:signal transduction histidine kinase
VRARRRLTPPRLLQVLELLLGGSIARPLDRLARTARAIGAGDLSARTGLRRRDELGAVARAFDEMAERMGGLLRAQTELIANVAHELRTPLSRIRVALDLAGEGDPATAGASLAEIEEDLAELEGLVSAVLAAARMDLASNTVGGGGAPPLRSAALDLAGVARQAVERLRHRHPERPVVLELAPVPAVLGDAVLLRRVLDNLLDNARKYSPADAAIAVRPGTLGATATVEVSDRGEGIAPADLARLFTPFFRADPSRARATGGGPGVGARAPHRRGARGDPHRPERPRRRDDTHPRAPRPARARGWGAGAKLLSGPLPGWSRRATRRPRARAAPQRARVAGPLASEDRLSASPGVSHAGTVEGQAGSRLPHGA